MRLITIRRNPISTAALFTVIFSFMLPAFSWAFEAATYAPVPGAVPIQQTRFRIPQALGSVSEYATGPGQTVICIQDLHCHYEVQKNIAHLLDYLHKKHQVSLIGVEGAFAPLDLSVLRDFPLAKVREAVSDFYVRKGKLTGAEYFGATSQEPVSLIGLESEAEYRASQRAVASFLNAESHGMILDLQAALDECKPVIYAPDLARFDTLRARYRSGRLDALRYGLELRAWASRHGEDLTAFPRVAAWLSAKDRAAGAGSEAVFQELDELDRRVRQQLYTRAAEPQLDEWQRRLEIIERLLSIAVTPDELEQVRRHPEQFSIQPLVGFLREHLAEEELTDPAWQSLDNDLRQAGEFYRLADQRSEQFVDHLLAGMQAQGARLGVMVNGGFHAKKVADTLKRRGISYLVIQPAMTRFDLANPYFSLLQGKKLPIEKLLERNQNIMAIESAVTQPGFIRLLVTELGALGMAAAHTAQDRLKAYFTQHPEPGLTLLESQASRTLVEVTGQAVRPSYLLVSPADLTAADRAFIQQNGSLSDQIGPWSRIASASREQLAAIGRRLAARQPSLWSRFQAWPPLAAARQWLSRIRWRPLRVYVLAGLGPWIPAAAVIEWPVYLAQKNNDESESASLRAEGRNIGGRFKNGQPMDKNNTKILEVWAPFLEIAGVEKIEPEHHDNRWSWTVTSARTPVLEAIMNVTLGGTVMLHLIIDQNQSIALVIEATEEDTHYIGMITTQENSASEVYASLEQRIELGLTALPPKKIKPFELVKMVFIQELNQQLPVYVSVFLPFGPSSQVLIKSVQEHKNKRVCEMGCGMGVVSALVMRKGAREVVAVDFNPMAVATANEVSRRLGLTRQMHASVGDVFNLVSKEELGKFDHVYFNPPMLNYKASSVSKQAVNDPGFKVIEKFLKQVINHLEPNGMITVVYLTRHNPKFFHLVYQQGLIFRNVLNESENILGEVEGAAFILEKKTPEQTALESMRINLSGLGQKFQVRLAAANALSYEGEAGFKVIAEELPKIADPNVRSALYRSLGRLISVIPEDIPKFKKSAMSVILDGIDDVHPMVRRAAGDAFDFVSKYNNKNTGGIMPWLRDAVAGVVDYAFLRLGLWRVLAGLTERLKLTLWLGSRASGLAPPVTRETQKVWAEWLYAKVVAPLLENHLIVWLAGPTLYALGHYAGLDLTAWLSPDTAAWILFPLLHLIPTVQKGKLQVVSKGNFAWSLGLASAGMVLGLSPVSLPAILLHAVLNGPASWFNDIGKTAPDTATRVKTFLMRISRQEYYASSLKWVLAGLLAGSLTVLVLSGIHLVTPDISLITMPIFTGIMLPAHNQASKDPVNEYLEIWSKKNDNKTQAGTVRKHIPELVINLLPLLYPRALAQVDSVYQPLLVNEDWSAVAQEGLREALEQNKNSIFSLGFISFLIRHMTSRIESEIAARMEKIWPKHKELNPDIQKNLNEFYLPWALACLAEFQSEHPGLQVAVNAETAKQGLDFVITKYFKQQFIRPFSFPNFLKKHLTIHFRHVSGLPQVKGVPRKSGTASGAVMPWLQDVAVGVVDYAFLHLGIWQGLVRLTERLKQTQWLGSRASGLAPPVTRETQKVWAEWLYAKVVAPLLENHLIVWLAGPTLYALGHYAGLDLTAWLSPDTAAWILFPLLHLIPTVQKGKLQVVSKGNFAWSLGLASAGMVLGLSPVSLPAILLHAVLNGPASWFNRVRLIAWLRDRLRRQMQALVQRLHGTGAASEDNLKYARDPGEEDTEALEDRQPKAAYGGQMPWLKALWVQRGVKRYQAKNPRSGGAALKAEQVRLENQYQGWAWAIELLPMSLGGLLAASMAVWTGTLDPQSVALIFIQGSWVAFALEHLFPKTKQGWKALRSGKGKLAYQDFTRPDWMNVGIAFGLAVFNLLLTGAAPHSLAGVLALAVIGPLSHWYANRTLRIAAQAAQAPATLPSLRNLLGEGEVNQAYFNRHVIGEAIYQNRLTIFGSLEGERLSGILDRVRIRLGSTVSLAYEPMSLGPNQTDDVAWVVTVPVELARVMEPGAKRYALGSRILGVGLRQSFRRFTQDVTAQYAVETSLAVRYWGSVVERYIAGDAAAMGLIRRAALDPKTRSELKEALAGINQKYRGRNVLGHEGHRPVFTPAGLAPNRQYRYLLLWRSLFDQFEPVPGVQDRFRHQQQRWLHLAVDSSA